MKEQIPQPVSLSRTLQGKTHEANTASVTDVLQAYKKDLSQRQEVDEEELLQGNFETAQRQEAPNNTGLPDNLKAGVEQLSGLDMSDVKVHYNSSKPASVQAYAYTQGTDIHVAPGQEKHLGHEAWHVVQQKQGRVQPTTTVGGMAVNDNAGLEKEADVLGGKTVQMKLEKNRSGAVANSAVRRKSTVKQGFWFGDNRSEIIAQKKLREIAASQSNDSIQRQEFPIVPEAQCESKLSPTMQRMPVQRLQIQHGLAPAAYQGVLRNTVLAYACLVIPGVGNFQNHSTSGPAGHAEGQLIAWAIVLLPVLIPLGTLFEIWVSSSPCSNTFGTSPLPPGCMERLQAFAATGVNVIVHADHPYQPRGPGMKAASVGAAGALAAGAVGIPPIPIDFSKRTGVAVGLTAYPLVAGAGHAVQPVHGTVAQLSGKAMSTSVKEQTDLAEEDDKRIADFATKPGTVKLVYGA